MSENCEHGIYTCHRCAEGIAAELSELRTTITELNEVILNARDQLDVDKPDEAFAILETWLMKDEVVKG